MSRSYAICTRAITRTTPAKTAPQSAQLTLDLSFNRHHESKTYSQTQDSSEIDPFTIPDHLSDPPTPTTSREPLAEELQAHYQTWTFPIRTDSPRGLIWGPFPNEESNKIEKSSSSRKRTTPERVIGPDHKRRQIFAILRPFRHQPVDQPIFKTISKPTVIQSKITKLSSRRRSLVKHSIDQEAKLVHVSVSPSKIKFKQQSRITLCVESQLKYCS